MWQLQNLGNDLKVPNETHGKNGNEFWEKSVIEGHLNEESNEVTILNGRLKVSLSVRML